MPIKELYTKFSTSLKIFLSTEMWDLYRYGSTPQYKLPNKELHAFFLRLIQIEGAKDIEKLQTISQIKLQQIDGEDYSINLHNLKMSISIKRNKKRSSTTTHPYLCKIECIVF